MKKEIWKDINGYNGMYKVSNLGRVKSIKRKGVVNDRLLKLNNSDGYLKVELFTKGNRETIRVHQLVAESFLGHIRCGFKLVINHIDFDKHNNTVSNLEITTVRRNTDRKHLISSSKYVGVSWCNRGNKWRSCIKVNGKLEHLGYFKKELDASECYIKRLNAVIKTKHYESTTIQKIKSN